jgi:lysozyme family protein
MNQSKIEKEFYQEIRDALDIYNEYFEEHLKNPDSNPNLSDQAEREAFKTLHGKNWSIEEVEAMKKIISNVVIGVVHSLFVSVDGGTALSNDGKALELIDRKTGKPLTEGALHENFMDVF